MTCIEEIKPKKVNRIKGTLSRFNNEHSYQVRKVTTYHKKLYLMLWKQIDKWMTFYKQRSKT